MKWSLQELRSFYRKPLTFDEHVDFSELMKRDKEIRRISPVHVKGHADITQQKATFYITVEGEMILPCSTTLVDVEFPFSIKTTEIFLLDPGFPISSEEENLHKVEGNVIDLNPYIEEHILLAKPIKVTSKCEGASQAPHSGEGWQVVTEEDRKNKIDPRLADLAKFFERDNK
ncbi:YceD family protein [Fictibacillus sp. Mic-4]|uniref:YceD family protein n=1 Tax=Fictibacillus TaxID=1329200 RepID=UPI000418DB05|nr:YceD family protein [Fictibacillus gelatini]